MNKLESIVIVDNPHGAVATIRFEDGKDDKLISSNSKTAKGRETLYTLIEQHVTGVLNG